MLPEGYDEMSNVVETVLSNLPIELLDGSAQRNASEISTFLLKTNLWEKLMKSAFARR